WTAQFDDLYFVRVLNDGPTPVSSYDLNVRRTTGATCNDAFETANGPDNTPQTAIPLTDDATTPVGCTLPGSLSGTHAGPCTGRPTFPPPPPARPRPPRATTMPPALRRPPPPRRPPCCKTRPTSMTCSQAPASWAWSRATRSR